MRTLALVFATVLGLSTSVAYAADPVKPAQAQTKAKADSAKKKKAPKKDKKPVEAPTKK
jgi:phage protein D